MVDFIAEAERIRPALLEDRRALHRQAEAGMNLPETTAHVMKRLQAMGLEPKELCPSGVTACIQGGKPGKVFLLRADMDALPMQEETTLPFKSGTGCAHQCGHDFHAAMLLGAARLLLDVREHLHGTVKLMFQPGEEVFQGARAMLKAGILENPKVDAAMALHVCSDEPAGAVYYAPGNMYASCFGFRIVITGRGSHGAEPHNGIDPINVGFHIYSAFQNVIARECPPTQTVVLTIGQFQAGTANNILPETAMMSGTLRCYDDALRKKLCKRLPEIAALCAKTFGATVAFEVLSDVPPTYNQPDMMREVRGFIESMNYPFRFKDDHILTGSEDFSLVAEKVPAVMMFLTAQTPGNNYGLHNPKLELSEEALPLGAAIHAQCAFNWLQNHC